MPRSWRRGWVGKAASAEPVLTCLFVHLDGGLVVIYSNDLPHQLVVTYAHLAACDAVDQ